MWIQTPGPVDDRLVLLGTRKNCVYLLKGDRYALVGGAGQWVVPELERQLEQFSVDTDRIGYLVVGHAHFDHCGAVPYLQARYPHIQVIASPGAERIFAHPKAVKNIRTFSREATERMGCPMAFDGRSLEWTGVRLDRTVRDGEELALGGGLTLRFYEAPGHSRCALIGCVPERGWLFPTDALHVPSDDGTTFACTASESFVTYVESLGKVAAFETSLCAWEHHGVFTDGDAAGIVPRGIEFTRRFHVDVRSRIARGEDREAVARDLCREWMIRAQFPFVTDRILLHITRGMVTNALSEPVP
ncbi:MAG: MBL fold metallo-hydrolase [Deferrisomatales bacterium]